MMYPLGFWQQDPVYIILRKRQLVPEFLGKKVSQSRALNQSSERYSRHSLLADDDIMFAFASNLSAYFSSFRLFILSLFGCACWIVSEIEY
jgi:hypothetical protein